MIQIDRAPEPQEPPSVTRKRLRDNRPTTKKKVMVWCGIALASAFGVWLSFNYFKSSKWLASILLALVFVIIGTQYLKPHIDAGPPVETPKIKKITKRTVLCGAICLIAIPLTIWLGIKLGGDRKYYFVSLAIVVYTIIPFLVSFEGRKPQARELVVIATLSAIAVAGRAAFFMLPQFKPVLALVIIAGVCFGGESGFLVGAVTAFVSNFLFGQGPWTPWQMFAFGIIGFLAGLLFQKGLLKTSKLPICVFGGLTAFLIYGPIMNLASASMWTNDLSPGVIMSYMITGVPFDLVHGVATVFFLSIFSQPMIEKLERIKTKYGLMEVNQ